MLPVIPPLVVFFLIIGGVVRAPRNLPEIALWLIMLALYGRMWLFLIRDARRLTEEAAAVDRRFRDLIGDGSFDADVTIAIPVRAGRAAARSARAGPVIALVGRPIDERDASVQRFPLTAVGDVRTRLDRYMARVRPSVVICSAASGADLLALDVAEAHHVRRRVVLPCERARFRHAAVTNRPGTWGPLFDRIIGALPSEDVIVLTDGDSGDDAAASGVVNAAILDHAILAGAVAPAVHGASGPGAAHGSGTAARAVNGEANVVAVIVWEARPAELASAPDPVAAFRSEAERRGIRVDEIRTT